MTEKDIKQAIEESIKAFGEGDLTENALNLFSILGYNTELQFSFEEKTYQYFKEFVLEWDTNFNGEKARVSDWNYIDLLFQLSKNEMSGQLDFFDTKQIDQKVMESYLFFVIELKNYEYSRTALAEITREMNRVFPMPAMILFKYGKNITLSVIDRRLNKKDEQKDVLKKVTLIKDISIENPHRAHIEILFDLSFEELRRVHNFSNFVELHDAWKKTLDTKELNKRFYKELSNWYFWAMKEAFFPDSPVQASMGADPMKDPEVREHNAKNLIRLLTRILFVWFIKEKKLIPEELFDETYIKNNLIDGFHPQRQEDLNHSTQESKYYKAVLQNLFFATLNRTAGKREFRKEGQHMNVTNLMRYKGYFKDPQRFIKMVEDVVPFMNGGLFECLDSPVPDRKGKRGGDIINYEDGFSDRKDNPLCVPDYIFFGVDEHADLSEELGDKKKKNVEIKGLINILKSYKFTVTENTPIEEDIALDPELLGRVFENLLASYNPETKTTARKQTGSFYTPREIVNYMVDESIKAYLKQKLECTSNLQSKGTSSFQLEASTPDLNPESTSSFQLETSPPTINFPLEDILSANSEVDITNRKLPHWQIKDSTYFVTFRLADSIPKDVSDQMKQEREQWHKIHKKPYSRGDLKEYHRLFSHRTEQIMDEGCGSCCLADPENANIVASALLHFDKQRYILDEWVVMSNHVHLIVTPLGDHSLTDILHSWKSFTANKINKRMGKSGQLWTHESYDHIIRNEKSLEQIREYIRNNPVKAGMTEFRASWENEAESDQNIVSGEITTSRDACSTIKSVPSNGTSSIQPFGTSSFQLESPLPNPSPNCTSSIQPIGTSSFQLEAPLPNLSPNCTSSLQIEDRLADLIAYNNTKHQFNDEETGILIEAIDNCKILDPACGSGAFPMGILHKLVHILHKLDPNNKLWKERQIEKVDKLIEDAGSISDTEIREKIIKDLENSKRDIEDAFESNELDYGRKLYLIENCIYGVDIQPIAAQISKLRFFISLIVDQKVDRSKPNFGVRPLPNLETKFVAANTLIGIEKPEGQTINFLQDNQEIQKVEKELKEIRHLMFSAKTPKRKRELREKDKELREKLAKLLTDNGWDSGTALQLAHWDPYDQNSSSPFFDPEWMFGIRDGFDIVIGNPPYVSLSKIRERNDYLRQNFQTFDNSSDIYCLFIEKSNQFLTNKGISCLITSNQWLQTNYGKKLRRYFVERVNPLKLINFGGFKVFASATVDTSILIIRNEPCRYELLACHFKNNYSSEESIGSYFAENCILLSDLKADRWRIIDDYISKVKEKVRKSGELLREWSININYGIKTGLNEAFIIDNNTKNQLCHEDPKSVEIFRPILRGRDIHKHHIEWADLWLIVSKNGINIHKDYKAVYRHLKKFGENIKTRSDQGENWWNLRACKYYSSLDTDKIIYPETTVRRSEFYLDKDKYYIDKTCFMITGSHLCFLISILSSKLMEWYLETELRLLGKNSIQYSKQFIEKIPVPKPNIEHEKTFITIVDFIYLYRKKLNPFFFESLIDSMVYEIYFPDEVKAAGAEVMKHLINLPQLRDDWDDQKKLAVIEEVYRELSDPSHPVSIAMKKMKTVPEVRIIEGLDKV